MTSNNGKNPQTQSELDNETEDRKVNQAREQSDTEPFARPKEGAEARKPDPTDTDQRIETAGAVGAAAALFQTIPH